LIPLFTVNCKGEGNALGNLPDFLAKSRAGTVAQLTLRWLDSLEMTWTKATQSQRESLDKE
jgi:hypothetical protein